ncbi:MAG: beta-galactosidase [Phycisphaeraceae bacterium]
MPDRYPPINAKCPHLLHGGDYNPDQWLDRPDILAEDMRLMALAHCNAATLGIFAWTALEPEEGRFEFGWLDAAMDRLADNGAFAVLATPSGARPAWMSHKYPQVLRVRADRGRNLHGTRHNHCFTSPIYREKVGVINHKLAERYKDHPALLVWHISNEYNGDCHCPLCQDAFRQWLRGRYGDDLDRLNRAWWTTFWSHTYTDWSQVESPSPIGESAVHGHNLDWKRFVTHQTADFMRHEIAPLKKITPDIPVTTNFMGVYPGLNYWQLAELCDVISWDSYPSWHEADSDVGLAAKIAFMHDINRCLKGGRPFMLMESTPSHVNWQPVCKLKRDGMHLLSSLHAIAHGSDTVQYFQWRKSRGASEKLHGAVVDHVGHEHTRVFREVAKVGESLSQLDAVVGTTKPAEAAVIYDWENRWAIDDLQGLGREQKKYEETCVAHYRALWRLNLGVDVIDQTVDLSRYRLVVAPMLYMLRPGMAKKLRRFVEDGGTLVMTYWSGIVDENDLCHLGGWPGEGLGEVLGIWDEETDTLHPAQRNHIIFTDDNELALDGDYEVRDLCALIHSRGAQVLAAYAGDFYAGRPAMTLNRFGKGEAFYIAARGDDELLTALYTKLARRLHLPAALEKRSPEGVSVQLRTDGRQRFLFAMNFTTATQTVQLDAGTYRNLLTGRDVTGELELPGYGVAVLRR